MAQRRMFAKKITESDAFLDMPMSSQCLYFHLAINADDEGFVNNPKKLQRMIGATDDDVKVLLAKRFIILFDSGVIVIKHWRMHNYIQSDRFRKTDYVEERSKLVIKDNNSYKLISDDVEISTMYPKCIQNVSKVDTQYSIVKDSIDKVSIDNILSGSPETNADCDPFFMELCKEIIVYLNETCGTNYRESSKATQRLIKARLNDGFTVDDFKTVIYKKAKQWKDNSKMCAYLRPQTLFGTKFEGYLNEKESLNAMERWDQA